jgi:hypothetical protein
MWHKVKLVLRAEERTLDLNIWNKRKLKTGLSAGGSACNPSYSGSRDQEDHGSKPAQANSS